MGKASAKFNDGKSTITKDKLGEADFDQLVIDTSNKVTRQRSNLLDQTDEPAGIINEQHQQSTICVDDKTNDSRNLSQPKRPMNAFMVWGQAIRRELHHQFSNVQNALLSKALGRVWRSLGAEEKEPYMRQANLIKANHKRNYPNYRYQPRRVQERRGRGSMLIGINLNHPVNQQRPPAVVGLNQYLAQADKSILVQTTKNQYRLPTSLSQQVNGDRTAMGQESNLEPLCITTSVDADAIKQVDSMQGYEYQAYLPTQLEQPNSSAIHGCKNYRSSSLIGQNESSQHGLYQQQATNAVIEVSQQQQQQQLNGEFTSYLPYQQPNYYMQQQQSYHHHRPQLMYESPKPTFLDTRAPTTIINNDSGTCCQYVTSATLSSSYNNKTQQAKPGWQIFRTHGINYDHRESTSDFN